MNVLTSYAVATDNTFNKNLYSRLFDNLKIITKEELENSEQQCKEVCIAVYIRTDVDNLVLMLDEDSISEVLSAPSIVTDCGTVYPTILIDASTYLGRLLIDKVFTFKNHDAIFRFAKLSTCYPVGAVETKDKYITVFNVVISSNILTDKDIVLNEGYCFYPIESLNLTDILQKEIAKSLVLVKRKEG